MRGVLKTMVNTLFFIIGILAITSVAVLRIVVFLHMLQLEGYKNIRFIKWLTRNPHKIVMIKSIKEPKKRLVFTARAIRLFIITLLLLAFLIYSLLTLPIPLFFTGLLVIAAFVPILLVISNTLIHPLEGVINNLYLKSAKKRLQGLKPRVIAITGSYGKTSTKDFLSSILSKRYRVLKTPGSFNTPMGICKVIREELRPEHEIFIVETGARDRGDIKELCNLVKPDIGVVTGIGPQHLETFGTVENIKNTKYELIESLPVGGIVVLNNDDENCRDFAKRIRDKKVLRYGVDEANDKPHLIARDISTSSEGITFLVENRKGEGVPFCCKLLGRHNVYNILAATAVAMECGLSLGEIGRAVKMIEPTPHRLQLIKGIGDVIVIDDAFNANPIGAKTALEVLNGFKGGRKILVTPGFIELGKEEYEENKRLGMAAANVCDFVFLVGQKRTKPIFEGLKQANYPLENVFVERNLKGVTERFKNFLKAGDIVLFENDLPDNYNE